VRALVAAPFLVNDLSYGVRRHAKLIDTGRGLAARVRPANPPHRGARTATTPSSDPTRAIALQGLVLYIEGIPNNFALVEALLSEHPGLRLIHAADGSEGVRLARSEHPDAVLLDMHLPDMSGIEVVRMLSNNIAAGEFRVILLTADKLNIDVLKTMSLGALEYLVKPADRLAIEAALDRALSSKRANKLAGSHRTRP
jgi:CheY-like chemotaxis protein